MDDWNLPGESSVKGRVLHHTGEIRYSWLIGEISNRPPISIEIHPTNACNLRCVFCTYLGVRDDELLDAAAFRSLVADLTACAPTLRSVIFSGGGEPSLHPVLPEAIHTLCDAGIEVGVITNGVRVSDALLDAYARTAWIRVSLDTPHPEPYRAFLSPHSSLNFDRVLTNLRRITSARAQRGARTPVVGIGYIIDRFCQSGESVLHCLDLAHDVGADYVAYRPLIRHPELQITRPLEEFAAATPAVREHAKTLGIAHQYHKFVREFGRTIAQEPNAQDERCPIVADGLVGFVAATGDVLPCYALYMDGRGDAVRFGNINSERFLDIWTGSLRSEVIGKLDAAKTCPFCRFQGHNFVMWDLAAQRGGTEFGSPTCANNTIDHSDPHRNFL